MMINSISILYYIIENILDKNKNKNDWKKREFKSIWEKWKKDIYKCPFLTFEKAYAKKQRFFI